MSLGAALNTSVTGLAVNQESLAVLANNIANANVDEYRRKVVTQTPNYVGGAGAGVSIGEVKSIVDDLVTNSVRVQGTAVRKTGIIDEYFKRIQVLWGEPDGGSSLNSITSSFFNSLSALATSQNKAFLEAMRQ